MYEDYHLAYLVRSGVMSMHTVTLLMTIWNAQWTLSSLYSLKYFLLITTQDFHYITAHVHGRLHPAKSNTGSQIYC